MPTSPAPICKKGGFSLIEVIVAAAIAFMIIAAAASAMITAEKSNRAGGFYRDAVREAQQLHAGTYGISFPGRSPAFRINESRKKSEDPGKPGWMMYEVADPSTGRSITTCVISF